MKHVLAAMALALFCGQVALAAEPATQQDKMKACNADAEKKALKGDERKKFMSECLSAKKDDEAKSTAQQDKMKACNEEAGKKALKGDERKKFMSDCLSKK